MNETPNFVMHDALSVPRLCVTSRARKTFNLSNKQRSRAVKLVTIAFASAIALSAVAPAFAYENDLESGASASSMHPGEHQAAGKHAGQHRAFDARASMPVTMPAVMPVTPPAGEIPDFGIGSQS